MLNNRVIGVNQSTRRKLLTIPATGISYGKDPIVDNTTALGNDLILPSLPSMLSGMNRIYEIGSSLINNVVTLNGVGGGTNPYVEFGQSFRGDGSYITGMFIYARKTSGAIGGNITVSIYAHTGTFGTTGTPTGSAVATSLLDLGNFSQVDSIGYMFTHFNVPFKTTSGTNYFIALAFSGANGVIVGVNSGTSTMSGNGAYRTSVGGAWTADTTKRLVFTLGGYDSIYGLTKYDFSNADNAISFGTSGYQNIGFTFTSASTYIEKIVLRLTVYSTVAGVATIGIYATSASVPTGSALAVSNPIKLTELPDSLEVNVAFDFDTPVVTSSGVTYAAVLQYSGGTISTDVNILIAADGSTPSSSSTTFYQTLGSSTYVTDSTTDICYNIYTLALSEAQFDSYDAGVNGDQYNYVAGSGENRRIAQSFTGVNGLFSKVTVNLRKTGSPTGNITAVLYAHTGTFGTTGTPTGTALATSDALSAASVSTVETAYTLTFSGANQYAMTEGTNYWISIEFSGGSTSNKIGIVMDVSSPTAPGRAAYYNGTSWGFTDNGTGASGTTDDMCYILYALQ